MQLPPAREFNPKGIPGRSEPTGDSAANDRSLRIVDPIRTALRWLQDDDTRRALGVVVADVFESSIRVVRSSRLPTRRGILDFFAHQVLINTVAWTAGLLAVRLVKSFFEVRGLRNLWGLTASGSRTLVSTDNYQLIMMLSSFCAGLAMMIFTRYFILRLLKEIRSLRLERLQDGSITSDFRTTPIGPPATDFEAFEPDHDD